MGRRIAAACWLAIAVLAGCDGPIDGADPTGGSTVRVLYDDAPLADVVVRLHAAAGGPVLDQAISAADGLAVFTHLPSPEPAGYEVSIMSAGDGGWIMDPKVTERFTATLRLEPFAQNKAQSIRLPRGAVRVL